MSVSAVDYGPNGGREWLVTFSGTAVEGNMPLLVPNTSKLTGNGVSVAITETLAGNEPSGRFMLQWDTAPRGWPEHRSGWIQVGASAAEVEQALVMIPGVRAADVSVDSTLPTVGPIAWEITFAHRQHLLVDDTDDLGFVSTGQSGDRPPLRVVR